ncbi:filamentous hemagglutinin N-terminal domain-containing protein, partial [Neptunomonas antarctica]
MNKIHRVIWSVRTGSWVVVAETTHSRGKGGGRAVGKALLAVLISSGLGAESALADQPATTVIPASGKTNAYISANGVPVVNIETANATGLSHNRYTRYDVEANGLVLNNGNNSQIARQSQLAGQVTSNMNLVKEATVILNEVVSVNRSTLAGYTEVLGGKADVIVANPYGITCDGCGFINTDRATLTTGTSTIGADGSLTGFTVNSGDVLIGAQGIDATAQQVLDMVTRSVKVDGNINTSPTGSLGITTGNNSWNYDSRNTTGTVAGNGAAPSYAIDSTALGGMYAGRIRIIATEAGVGVRMLGDAAASVDDFTISSAGKVEIQSAISAARDLAIASTSSTGNSDVFVKGLDAQLSAGHDLTVLATNGQVTLSEGELYAANNLDVTAASLSDVSTTDKARFAGADNTLVVSGEASIDGSVWGADNALSGTFDSLSVGANGATIHAGTTVDLSTTNDLTLANAAVRSTGDMTLAASAGTISTTSGTGQGIQTTNGNLSLTAGNGLNNAGTITADTGSVTARVDGTLNNSGTLHAKTTVDIADKANSSTENILNSGTLIADGSLVAKAASFTNQAGATVQGTTGTTVTATALINDGTFIASDTAGQSGNFTLSSLSNSGTLQSKEDLGFNVTGTLANTGKLLATHDLSVNAATSALAISNTNPGVIQAGNALTISGANATFNTQSGTVLGNTTGITVSSLNNSGTLQSNA